MPITSTSQKMADAINQMVAALKKEYGADFSYSICGKGMVLAQSNINGVKQPVPSVHPQSSIPSNCPICCGEREWSIVGVSADCHFCGYTMKV